MTWRKMCARHLRLYLMKITDIRAREILNSSATTSIEVIVSLEDGSIGKASVPFGVSAGTYEAFVLFDGGKRYGGKGMQKAADHVNSEIRDALLGEDAYNQRAIDEKMIELDGTINKGRLGANAILGVSMAVCRAASISKKLELYEYLREMEGSASPVTRAELPIPLIVVIEGGKHADNSTDFQEYLIAPQIKNSDGSVSMKESIRCGAEIYLALKDVLKGHGLSANVGNEGAYAPWGIRTNEEPWQLIMEAIAQAGYTAGQDVRLAADPASTEITEVGGYYLTREDRVFTSQEMIDYFGAWVTEYPFICIEDPLSEDDWEAWKEFTARFGNTVRVIGDDLLVTNPVRLERAIAEKACNGILIKLNQIGTLTETIGTMAMADAADFWNIVSHRGGGETDDTFMIDLAVAGRAKMVKVGIARGERVCKYNRLMEIEEKLK